MQNMEKAKPAIYILPGCSWGFVSLMELAEIVGMMPNETLENFFGLSKDIDTIAVVIEGKFVNATLDEITVDNIFVAAGWAQDVMGACRKGVVRVVQQSWTHLSDEDGWPEGTLLSTYSGSDFVCAIGLEADGQPIKI